MELSEKQKGVVRGVVPAALITATSMVGATLLVPANALPVNETGARLAWALQWALLPILALMISIIRVANHRFSTPADIDGSGLTAGTERILVLRAIVQNTLEQSVLACAAYAVWAVTLPYLWLRAVPIAAVLFVTGRILFARGYERGAPGRALGFGLTAYPTFGMLAVLLAAVSARWLSWMFWV
jgi:hypothetical protein